MQNAAQREIEMEEALTKAYEEYINERDEKYKEYVKNTIAQSSMVADATSGLLSSIADAYESNEESAKKNAKKVKALRIASATIDMLNGAVTAFTSAQELGVPLGPIMGAINAASVIAMGVANINKIRSTNVENASENGASVSASAPASVSAPNIETSMASVRNVTTASEEDRLNRMASSQKVYILQSDIEAAGHKSRVQVAESSF